MKDISQKDLILSLGQLALQALQKALQKIGDSPKEEWRGSHRIAGKLARISELSNDIGKLAE